MSHFRAHFRCGGRGAAGGIPKLWQSTPAPAQRKLRTTLINISNTESNSEKHKPQRDPRRKLVADRLVTRDCGHVMWSRRLPGKVRIVNHKDRRIVSTTDDQTKLGLLGAPSSIDFAFVFCHGVGGLSNRRVRVYAVVGSIYVWLCVDSLRLIDGLVERWSECTSLFQVANHREFVSPFRFEVSETRIVNNCEAAANQ